jgi:hypothetical protein
MSKSLLVKFFGVFLGIRLYHLQIRMIWLLLSLFEFLFISFHCLIALSTNSKTILTRSGVNEYFCLVQTLEKMISVFAHLVWWWLLALSYKPLLCCFYSQFLQSFYQERMLNFVKGFFYIYLDDHVFFVFSSVYMLHYIYWLVYVEPHLYPGMKPTWSWCIIIFMCCWIHFTSILLKMFVLC